MTDNQDDFMSMGLAAAQYEAMNQEFNKMMDEIKNEKNA